jgi:transposase-like protein
MTSNQKYSALIEEALTELTEQGLESLGPALERLFNELMLIEREQSLNAHPYERTEERKGYANGFKDKMLHTRIGKLKLQVPKTRNMAFYPSCLEKGIRSERALGLAMAEMYVNGVSTRRVKRITQELCGLDVSSTQVSRLTKSLDEELENFRNRPLGNMCYVYLDARYEKVRENGSVRDLAILTAIGINAEGCREILGISCALSEAEVHWRHFLEGLLKRGLTGVKLLISDDHAGLKKARQAVLPGTAWQRCFFHLAQNAQAYAPTMYMRQETGGVLRDIFTAPTRAEAKTRLEKAIDRYSSKAPKLSKWLEDNCEEGFAFYAYPQEHWKKIRTNNVSERLNQEIKRRTRVARLFPNSEAALRVATAVVVEIHEEWISGRKYLQV